MNMESKTKVVNIGSHIELHLVDREGKKEKLSFDIVPDEAADYSHGYLGVGTPLAKALLGEKAGVTIPYLKDDIYAIEILSVAPSKNKSFDNTQEKRQARLDKAIHEVEHTNAVVFASSFSGKWGDYDPDSLPKDDEQKNKGKHKDKGEQKDKGSK